MRLLLPSAVLLLLTACGESNPIIHGTLLPGSDATDVYVVGQPIRARVQADTFLLVGAEGERIHLEFAEEGERLGRMRIEGWNGERLALRGIWLDDGTAFATTLAEGGPATVNGLRMAPPDALPRTLAIEGEVLAVSRRGDALIVRPRDETLPDLRVVVTPGTELRNAEGERELDVEVGDSVRVEGTSESGYLVATRLEAGQP